MPTNPSLSTTLPPAPPHSSELATETAESVAAWWHAWTGMMQLMEAQAQHLAHPLFAGPMLWPLQEAMRQNLSLTASWWKDWSAWQQRCFGLSDPPPPH